MKIKELKDLRTKDIKSLQKLAHDKRVVIMKKSMEVMGGKEKNLKSVGILRSELAKILTLVREKQIIEKLEKGNTK